MCAGGRVSRLDRWERSATLQAPYDEWVWGQQAPTASVQGCWNSSFMAPYRVDDLKRYVEAAAVLALRGRWETGWLESWDGLV